MTFKRISSKLKTGQQIHIRTIKATEASELLKLKRHYIQRTTTIPLTLEEYPYDIEAEAETISSYNNAGNSLILVAEHQDEFIGNIDLTGHSRIKLNHTAMLGMGIKEKWRNKGLGKILINSALTWARTISTLEIIWLEVYATNEAGIRLYQKTGFEQAGLFKKFFKEDKIYIDKICMYQSI